MLTPDKLVAAAEARRAEFEAALTPASVVFDAVWPPSTPPQLGVGFQLGNRRHAIRVKQKEGEDTVEAALAYCRDNRVDLLGRVGMPMPEGK